MKLLDDYENLRQMVSMQNVIEVREKMTSNFRVNVRLKSSKGIVPIYNTICEQDPNEFRSNHLMDVTHKSAFIAETGDLLFSNDTTHRCPSGFSGLALNLSPQGFFAEDTALWWELQNSKKQPSKAH